MLLILFCLLARGVVGGDDVPATTWAVTGALPAWETHVLLDVGQSCGLTLEEQKLLLTIRRIENGGPGIEMGVASNYPRHRARRHANRPEQSLRVQAQWAAGTIKKHYSGDLYAFARTYCPPNWEHWARMARYWMNQE